MPGGSIGIAGPRGSGKTTLIASFCDAGSWSFKGRPVLSQMTSAPVDYEARDFILHLFSNLCARVLRLRAKNESVPSATQDRREFRARQLFRSLQRKSLFLFGMGAFLLALGLLLGVAQFEVNRMQIRSDNSSQSTQSTDTTISDGDRIDPIDDSGLAGSAGDNIPASVDDRASLLRTINDLSTAFGLQPFSFLLLGVIAFFIPFVGPWIESTFWYATDQSKSPGLVISEDKQIGAEGPEADSEGDESPIEDDLVNLARLNDTAIKFQQSFTSGWSGGLKLPSIGLETGVSTSHSVARRPLSLPEIVSEFREFASEITKEYELFIGIDELDKMDSDEKARRFLNDIKVLFGIDGCFYLLSVSESAMSNFERRGLPFRDEFDSSFDEILRVQYLDFERANALIKRRVVGMPMAFVALGYCMSGGLPRDLIRTCREIVAGPKTENKPLTIEQSCDRVLTSELRRKLHAIEIGLEGIRLEDEIAHFLDTLRNVKFDNISADKLFDNGQQFFDFAQGLAGLVGQGNAACFVNPDKLVKDQRTLRRLAEELATYFLYCSTICGLFDSTLNEVNFKKYEQDKIWHRIAHARQSFALNLRHSRSLLEEVRGEINLAPVNFVPSQPSALP